MNTLALVPVALTTLWIVVGVLALWQTRRRSMTRSAPMPVSVLKPLCGADPDLEKNLESFFEQDHRDYELLFGVERESDPAVAVVRRLEARNPHVRSRLIVHRASSGLNPKVRNLRALVPHAAHDLLIVSDSNVRAPRHYVREMAMAWSSSEDVGLVTSVFAGTNARSAAAELECVQLNGFCAAGATLPTLLGDAAIVGKSMAMSRADLERLGGLARVADVLAEDYILGKTFEHAGKRAIVAPTVLENVVGKTTVRALWERQVRWAMIRWRLRPWAHLLEPLSNPLVMLPFCAIAMGMVPALLWWLAMVWLRDVGGWLLLRGRNGMIAPLLLGPARDVLAIMVWAVAPLRRHVAWRGNRVRLGFGTLLYSASNL